jgi:DME family drug/metabolite transporter
VQPLGLAATLRQEARMHAALSGGGLVLATAALFSTGGVAIKACSLGSMEVAGYRSLIAAAVLMALLRPPRAAFRPAALAVGMAQAATMLLFVVANKHTTAAAAIFLQGAGPLWVALLSVLVLHEPMQRRDAGALVAYAAGLALLVHGSIAPFASAPDPFVGNLAALASSVTWAAVIAGLRALAMRGDQAASAAPVCGNALLAVATAPWLVHARPGATDALVLGWLGVFQVGLAYALLAYAVRRVRAFEASMLLLAEPVLSTLWAWLAFGERPAASGLAGSLLMLAAAAVSAGAATRRSRAAAAPPADTPGTTAAR